MDFHEVCQIFGGSIFPEEFRGNLKQLSYRFSWIDAPPEDHPLTGDDASIEWSRRTLLKAIWHALSGLPKQADGFLTQLIDAPNSNKRWVFRAHAYHILFSSWVENPPHFRFCDILMCPSKITCGQSLTEWASRFDPSADMEACLNLNEYAQGTDMTELHLFFAISQIPSAMRIGATQTQLLQQGQSLFAEDSDDENTDDFATPFMALDNAQGLLDANGLVLASAYLDRLGYEVFRRSGSSLQLKYFQRMESKYTRCADMHGLGICAMLRADQAFSGPFTSPIVLNLDIRDGWDDTNGHSDHYDASIGRSMMLWITKTAGYQELVPNLTEELVSPPIGNDTAHVPSNHCQRGSEASIDIPMLQRALRYLKQAEEYFEIAGSVRGVAAAILWQACCRSTTILLNRYSTPRVDAVTAAEHLLRSISLFDASGDIFSYMIAITHLSLYLGGIASDEYTKSIVVGEWAAKTFNEIFCLYLSLFLMRVALSFRYVKSLIVMPASILARCSKIMSLGVSQSSAILRAKAFQAEYTANIGDYQGASIIFSEMRYVLWQSLLRFFDPEKFQQENSINPLIFQLRICAHQLSIRQACETGLAILPHVTGRSTVIQTVVQELARFAENFAVLDFMRDPTTVWLDQQQRRLALVQILLQNQLLDSSSKSNEEAKASLLQRLSFLEQNAPPNLRLELAGALCDMGMLDKAADIVSEVQNIDVSLDDVPIILHAAPLLATRRFRNFEYLLRIHIRTKSWAEAATILDKIEKEAPGYFTGTCCYSPFPVWERFFSAGLVMESLGRYGLALRYLGQSFEIHRREQHLSQAGSATGLRLVLLETHNAKIVNAYVRVLLRLRDSGSYETELKPLLSSRVDLKDFEFFASPLEFLSGDPEADALIVFEHARVGTHNEVLSSSEVTNRAQLIKDQYKMQLMHEMLSLGRDLHEEEEAELERLREEVPEFSARLEEAQDQRDWNKIVWPRKEHIWRDLIESGRLYQTLVVYLSIDDSGLALFGLDESGVVYAEFDEAATARSVQRHVNTCLDDFITTNGKEDWGASREALGILSRWLLEPLQAAIDKSEHVIFIASGDLTRFPFGVLFHNNEHLGLTKAVSQVPSLYYLYTLMWRDERDQSPVSRFCAIAKPGSLKEQQRTGEGRLPMAGLEALVLSSFHETRPLNAADMMREDLVREFEQCDWLHISTHGKTDLDNPLFSFLSLREKVRVIDLLTVQSGIKMVVLSVCLSGWGKASDRGDVLGFSHAALAAGTNAFMGALWPANDLATLIHMIFFYAELVSNDRLAVAKAWQVATSKVFNIGQQDGAEMEEMLQNLINSWDAFDAVGLEPGKFVKNGRRILQGEKEKFGTGQSKINWRHPFFWAPFIIMGNPKLCYK